MVSPVAVPKPTSIRLPDDVRIQADKLAELTDRSRSYVVAEAVRQYTAERLAYLQELDEAVASIDTQPTYDLKDVRAWIHTWGTDDEKPLVRRQIIWDIRGVFRLEALAHP